MKFWHEILVFFEFHPELTVLGAITLIQIAPIKINPWSSLAGWVRDIFLGKVYGTLDRISTKIDKIEDAIEEREAVLARINILRFNDEIYNDIKHSKEYFDQTLEDIDRYDAYCDAHPEFRNSRTVIASQHIRDIYEKLFNEHKFL